jgi:hypothetical protein
MSTRPRPRSGFLLVFENEGVSEVAILPVSKTGPGGSSPPTLVNGCEAHQDEQASHKRKVVSSNLTAATKIWRYSCYWYVARAL